MNFPNKERINTELFIDRMAGLYNGERDVTKDGDQHVGTS